MIVKQWPMPLQLTDSSSHVAFILQGCELQDQGRQGGQEHPGSGDHPCMRWCHHRPQDAVKGFTACIA